MVNPLRLLKNTVRKSVQPRTYFCDHLWTSISVRVSGEVEPCSCAPNKGPLFNLLSAPVQAIWNNEWFKESRRFLLCGEEGRIFDCCRVCPVSLEDRYYLPTMRLRLLEPRLLHTRFLKPVSRSLLKQKHENYKSLLKILRQKTVVINANPIIANIDPSNVCNLHCPFCPVGAGELEHQPRGYMPLELYERVMEHLGAYLIYLELYRYGEPLLNPDIIPMLNLASHEFRIRTSISSNFSKPLSDDFLAGLIEGGLYRLTIAADDVEQSFYEQYRKGGNLDIVLDNLERLHRLRVKNKSPYPKIIWQTLIFRFNESRLDHIKSFVGKFGVDVFRPVPAYIPAHEDYTDWIPLGEGQRGRAAHRPEFISDVSVSPTNPSPLQTFRLQCRVTNNSGDIWQPEHGENGSIRVGIKLLNSEQKLLCEMGRIHLSKMLAPQYSTILDTTLPAPDKPGEYFLKLGMVKENHYWFEYNPQIQEAPAIVRFVISLK